MGIARRMNVEITEIAAPEAAISWLISLAPQEIPISMRCR
jgi:hypothetical protein